MGSYPVNQNPQLLGLAYSELVLIHATPRRPTLDPSGNVQVLSAFKNAGGFDQVTDPALIDDRKPLGVTTRPSVHFTLQDPVSDHAYGSFEGREFTIYAPLEAAISTNGAPESLFTSDTAFFAPDKPVVLPGAVVVQIDLKNQLKDHEFSRTIDGGLLVSSVLTEKNRAHAEELLAAAELKSPGLGAKEMLSYAQGASGALCAAEISKTLALGMLGAPTINKALGVKPESKIGFDGWASAESLREFLAEVPNIENKSVISIGRHDATSGDAVNTYFRTGNTARLDEIKGDKNPAIARFAQTITDSALHQRVRQHEILAELANEQSVITDSLGRSSPGMARSLFREDGHTYHSSQLGEVTKQEALLAIQSGSDVELKKVISNVFTRNSTSEADAALSQLVTQSKSWVPVVEETSIGPPPLPGTSGQASHSHAEPPKVAANTPPPLPGAAGFGSYAGIGIDPPMATKPSPPPLPGSSVHSPSAPAGSEPPVVGLIPFTNSPKSVLSDAEAIYSGSDLSTSTASIAAFLKKPEVEHDRSLTL